MGHPTEQSITAWLAQARDGDAAAMQHAFALVYDQLRQVAHRQMGGLGQGRTLNTTGLLHETFLRMSDRGAMARDRGHFFALAARVMRQVLVDFARERIAEKRGGGDRGVPLEGIDAAEVREAEELLVLNDALGRLFEREPRQAQVVECRYFAGLTESETAEALGIAERSVQRDWKNARQWLKSELSA